jgi:hypothetical protein
MSSQPVTGRLASTKSGSRAGRATFIARAAFILSAALAIAVPTLRADTAGQTELEAQIQSLQPGKTILSCSASVLAEAVANEIASPSNTCTPQDLAISAMQVYPYPTGTARPDRETSSILVTKAAINELLTLGTDTQFNIDAAQITYGVLSVGGTNTAINLNDEGQAEVAAAGIGTISDAYVAGTTAIPKATLLLADHAIGVSLSADTFLEGLSGKALVVIDEGALAGINGVNGTSAAAAPLAAQSLVQGMVVTGTVPDSAQGETFNEFAASLLSNTNVNVNASVDEYVANAIGAKDNNANPTSLVSLAEYLIGPYYTVPGFVTKVTQGIAADIPPVTTAGDAQENNRIAFVKALVTQYPGTVGIEALEGMVYVDPFYAGGPNGFTNGAFNALYTKSPSDLTADAPIIATGVGQVLGQDGNVLTQVASTYSTFLGAGKLPVTSAGTYATNLITGAETSTVPASQFTGKAAGAGGGQLNLTTPVTATVVDLASITDVLADGIITYYGSSLNANASTAASEIGTLAEDVAKFTGSEAFTDTQDSSRSGSVGVFIAATLADYIVGLNLASATQTDIINDIKLDVDQDVNAVQELQISNQMIDAENNDSKYISISGPVPVPVTACTNL